MKIDFSTVLKNFRGEEIKTPEEKTAATLGYVAIEALIANYPEVSDGATKLKRYQLATRIHGATELEVTVEEVAELKQLIGKLFATPVVGAAFPLLEGG